MNESAQDLVLSCRDDAGLFPPIQPFKGRHEFSGLPRGHSWPSNFGYDTAPAMDQLPLIEFKHVSIVRGHNRVLKDISLKIGVGEHLAVLGPNGCGKSTFIKAITRECYPLIEEGSSLRI